MAKQCSMCFQPKESLQEVVPRSGAVVCKSCNYKIRSVIGYLEYYNIRLVFQAPLTPTKSETPPDPPHQEITGDQIKI